MELCSGKGPGRDSNLWQQAAESWTQSVGRREERRSALQKQVSFGMHVVHGEAYEVHQTAFTCIAHGVSKSMMLCQSSYGMVLKVWPFTI